MSNPLQTELLIFGTCCPDDFPKYERYFNDTYRTGPILDRFGRRVIFREGSARHICFAKDQYEKSKTADRDTWRPDRAQRMPWIYVALTHTSSVLKENKEAGRQNYLVRMQLTGQSGFQVDYYQVIVSPDRRGPEVYFVSAYRLDLHDWTEAIKRKNVRPGLRK
jgi:hypothetical protein